jgi:multicomponent Na+:H+ antiporter subunit G
MEFVAAALLLIGSALSLLAALGLLRFPDVYTRLHAASKAGTLGAGLILLAAGVASGDWSTAVRCVLGLIFIVITSPVSAHLLARAALLEGIAPHQSTSIDEYPRRRTG